MIFANYYWIAFLSSIQTIAQHLRGEHLFTSKNHTERILQVISGPASVHLHSQANAYSHSHVILRPNESFSPSAAPTINPRNDVHNWDIGLLRAVDLFEDKPITVTDMVRVGEKLLFSGAN